MTYMRLARQLALMESHALRAWARAGRPVPACRRIDYWGEWQRHERMAAAHAAARRAA